ncbi:condensation domain-containing protein [Pseudomonas aeruginosa]|nr:condensation domain-containing protein [Pseudomonas aeruginosa]
MDMADGSQRLLLVIHHLAVDGVSWRILLEDLQRLYADLDADLGPRSSSYQTWSRHLHEQAGARLDELDYWQAQLTTLRMRCHAKTRMAPWKTAMSASSS